MAYRIKLQQFEGPLDLLLHLIEQAKLNIEDITISDITAQYLNYMAEVDALDMDAASEFLSMAATLVLIKSRTLLPRPPKEETDPEDAEAMLIRQLHEYKAIKEASERLQELQARQAASFARLPEEFVLPPQQYDLGEATAKELFCAFVGMLNRGEAESQDAAVTQRVSADAFTVRDQLKKIRAILATRPRVRFEEMFDSYASKLERIVTFMALLDMIMRHEISLKQNVPYGEITIFASKLADDDDDFEYMDEI